MFGKNDWLIKIRYTGSGSKKMNAAAAAALLSVCLCVSKEKQKRRGKKRARPTYLAGQIIIKTKRITKKRNRTLISLFFFFLSFSRALASHLIVTGGKTMSHFLNCDWYATRIF
jgi:hypothetical protein